MQGFSAAAVTVADLQQDPHPTLARLRQLAAVCWVPVLDGWLVTERAVACDVMRDASTFTVDDPRFSTAQVIGPSMLSRDGLAHTRHRAPFSAAFRPAQVRDRFAEIVTSHLQRLISAMARGTSAELRRELAGPLSAAVMTETLGLVDTDPAEVLRWYQAISGAVNAISAGQSSGTEAAGAMNELGLHVLRTLRHNHADSLLVSARNAGLNDDEVLSNAAVLMFGGIETTDAMITNAVYQLLVQPSRWQRLQSQPELLGNAVSESLRLEPAAANVDRYATKGVVVAGATIARGDLVIVSLAAANRDPQVFSDPDDFELTRHNADLQLAFAQGPHSCLGSQLARVETEQAIAGLLQQFPRLRLDLARSEPPRGLVFRKPAQLTVRWD